jgi:hypothetical protein
LTIVIVVLSVLQFCNSLLNLLWNSVLSTYTFKIAKSSRYIEHFINRKVSVFLVLSLFLKSTLILTSYSSFLIATVFYPFTFNLFVFLSIKYFYG